MEQNRENGREQARVAEHDVLINSCEGGDIYVGKFFLLL